MRPGMGRLGRVKRAPGPGDRADRSEHRRPEPPEKLQGGHSGAAAGPPRWPSDRGYRTMLRPRARRSGRAPSAGAQPVSAPRGIRARHPPVSRAPVRSRGRRRPRPGGRPAVRRDRPRPASRAARAEPAERRPARPAPRGAARGSRRAVPPRRADLRGLALRRRPAQGPARGLYVYEQVYRVPGTTLERTQRGFFARLRLEPFGPDGGVLPHERTLAGPREDRYRLLRATGVNTSPVVVLYGDPAASTRPDLAAIAAETPVDATSPTTTARATGCGSSPTTGRTASSRASRRPPAPGRCSSPTATTATRPRCATATSGA